MTNKDKTPAKLGRVVRCTSCGAPFQLPCDTLPFCSTRCKLHDLSKWFSEEYRVPVATSERSELEESLAGDLRGADGECPGEDQE